MGKNHSILNAIQSVHEAEEALITAQSYASPEYFQLADQKLILASQMLHSVKNDLLSFNEEEQKQFHQAKEQLRNLEENKTSLIF